MRNLDIPGIFKSEADDLRKCRADAIRIHGTADIKAAGNEIEIHIREFFTRMLPKTLYITHGHLIDKNGYVSPQLDIIIADSSNLPSLMTTKDKTEYVPIDSVYAIGEIKSTYYKNRKYVQSFSDVLKGIRDELHHEEIPNTAYQGKTGNNTLMRDIFLGKGNKTLNKIYSFMLFVDSGDFKFEDIYNHYTVYDKKYLPNSTVIINKGVIIFGEYNKDRFNHTRYPDEVSDENWNWYFCPFHGGGEGSLEGNHLGYLYYSIVEHISNSYLEPPSLSNYMAQMMFGRKSLLEKAGGN